MRSVWERKKWRMEDDGKDSVVEDEETRMAGLIKCGEI